MNSTKIQNNKFKDCPALMSDGRQFTDYRASSIINSSLMNNMNTHTSFDYRNKLTEDANSVILDNRDLAVDRNGCSYVVLVQQQLLVKCVNHLQLEILFQNNTVQVIIKKLMNLKFLLKPI